MLWTTLRDVLLILCWTLSLAHLHAQTKAITGQVIDADSKEKLPYANVMIKGTRIGTQANLDGFFLLHNAPDTTFVLHVTYLGYVPVEIVVNPQQKSSGILAALKQTAILMSEVTVSAVQSNFIKTETTPSKTTVSPTQIANLPSVGQVDIFRSIQLLPGISATNDGSSGLFVRGGTPDQNLVVFDGMTVYHVDHFFGFFSAFNPDAIKDVQLYKGAFPARFGGRLSCVVDMVGRTGNMDKLHGTMGLSLLSANASLEFPLLDGTLFFSGRRSFNDLIESDTYNTLYKLMTGSDVPGTTSGLRGMGGMGGFGGGVSMQETPTSAFYDINTKLTYSPTSRSTLTFSYYGSGDEYDLAREVSTQNISGFGGQFRIPSRTSNTKQGNMGASTKLFAQWRDDLYSDIVLAYAGYSSTYSSNMGSRTGNTPRFSTDEDNRIDDLSFQINNGWKLSSEHEFEFGLQLSQTRVKYALSGANPTGGSTNLLDLDQQGWLNAGYLQEKWNVTPRLTLTGGLRFNNYTPTRSWYIEPRFSTRLELTDNLSLKGAIGIHHQFVNRILNENMTEGSRDFWILADQSLAPSKAIHYVAGASWENAEYLVDIEGFYKDQSNLVEFTQRYRRQALDLYTFLSGNGTVQGAEFLLQKKFGMLNGWISYTLSKSEKRFPEINYGEYFPSENDQNHELKLVGILSPGSGWNISSTFIFATGKPYTAPISQYSLTMLDNTTYSYTHVSEKNAYRLPDYHRLDFSVSKKFRVGKNSLNAGLSIFNVYNRANISYYEYNLESQPIIVTAVTGLGFLPTIFLQYEF